jgi:antitoxin CcdA
MGVKMTIAQFDTAAPKKATNLSINADLLRQAKELNINLSQTLEQHLAERVREVRRQQWLVENKDAIADYNQRVEAQGVFSDGLRSF